MQQIKKGASTKIMLKIHKAGQRLGGVWTKNVFCWQKAIFMGKEKCIICFHSSGPGDRNSRLVHLSRNRQAGQNCVRVQIPISWLFLNLKAFEKFAMATSMASRSSLESNLSSSGTGCKLSVSVSML